MVFRASIRAEAGIFRYKTRRPALRVTRGGTPGSTPSLAEIAQPDMSGAATKCVERIRAIAHRRTGVDDIAFVKKAWDFERVTGGDDGGEEKTEEVVLHQPRRGRRLGWRWFAQGRPDAMGPPQ